MNTHKHNKSEALLNYNASDFNTQLLKKFSLKELFDYCIQEENPRLAFRAAWALEHILLKNQELFLENYQQVIQCFILSNNWSCLRSFTKLIMSITDRKQLQYKLTIEQEESLLEKTYNIIEHLECPIAVRVNAWDILYNLSSKHEWLISELETLIVFILEKESTPAIKSRGLKILKRIRKN